MGEETHTGIENKNRRTFLLMSVTGVLAFFAGKIFDAGSLFTEPKKQVTAEKDFKNFSLTETGAELSLKDKEGNDIFIIDKDSFK